jgi:hypothetical protein
MIEPSELKVWRGNDKYSLELSITMDKPDFIFSSICEIGYLRKGTKIKCCCFNNKTNESKWISFYTTECLSTSNFDSIVIHNCNMSKDRKILLICMDVYEIISPTYDKLRYEGTLRIINKETTLSSLLEKSKNVNKMMF